ncbi:hypothetical protein GGR54DRAFT_639503 [Hypoxylon sp. NC1633]|nr:hypothetical protein GGR54DRAFT_639503 [Hypoxylon sp. NC1633]
MPPKKSPGKRQLRHERQQRMNHAREVRLERLNARRNKLDLAAQPQEDACDVQDEHREVEQDPGNAPRTPDPKTGVSNRPETPVAPDLNESPRPGKAEERDIPCQRCLYSAFHGHSLGECHDAQGKGARCYECAPGYMCHPIPEEAVPNVRRYLTALRSGVPNVESPLPLSYWLQLTEIIRRMSFIAFGLRDVVGTRTGTKTKIKSPRRRDHF